MRLLWVIGVLAFAALCPAARAFSPIIEIFPDGPDHGTKGYAVAVSAARLAAGNTEFTVTVSPKHPRPQIGTSLGSATSDASGFGHIAKEGRRHLENERMGDSSFQCVFTVTPQELANPDLSFIITIAPSNPDAWAFTTYYFRLKKFVKPGTERMKDEG